MNNQVGVQYVSEADPITGELREYRERYIPKKLQASLSRKKLKPKYKVIAKLHLAGHDAQRISDIFEELGQPVTRVAVCQILNSDAMRSYLAAHHAVLDQEVKALEHKAVSAVSRALEVEVGINHQLRAAELVFRANNRFGDRPQSAISAEDVIARALAVAGKSVEAIRDVATARRSHVLNLRPQVVEQVIEEKEGSTTPSCPNPRQDDGI